MSEMSSDLATSPLHPHLAASLQVDNPDRVYWRVGSGVVETTLLLPAALYLKLEADARRNRVSIGRLIRELLRTRLASTSSFRPE